MNQEDFKRIKQITEIQSTSGFEHNIRAFMRDELTPLVDKVHVDGLGGIFGVRENKNNGAPKLMLAAHMDEVGFMVINITTNGLIKVRPLGGWNPYVVSAQRFTLQTDNGDYPVVSSSVPPHLLRGGGSQKVKVEDILFDAGFSSKEEAESYGVRPGQPIVPDVETIQMANGKTILGKAWDNRFGVTAVLEALKEVKDDTLPNTLIAGANVQEEVGLRGTRGAVRKFQPDAFFAIDASPADDMDGQKDANGRIGDGILIRIQDPGYIMSKEMRDYILDTAESNNIPYQYFVSNGGTDAVAAHQLLEGIPTGVVGIPARYIHTHQTLFHIDDYYAAKEMLVQLMKTFDKSTLDTITVK
ncbi:MAG TPA: glutamyl aminopeptidase [Alloiococcus sp.]|nr:glutamyl aminopeptidase [Alloiococcus sp.]